MAAAALSFGSIAPFGIVKRQRSRERLMPKAQQIAKIQQFLSNRGAEVQTLNLVEDWVDPLVGYTDNKAEIIRRVGFGDTQRQSKRAFREMQCASLSNTCRMDGVETCETACDECGDAAACKKAEAIKAEIKRHGRELTSMERLRREISKEAKRPLKKAAFTKGQFVKCREGYELRCGFAGAQKVTQVKAYPDYVLYGIQGKAEGFVDEEAIEKAKPKKPQTDAEIDKEMKRMAKRDEERFKRAERKKPKIPTGMTLQKSLSKTGGQLHFKNGGGKKKAKALTTKKTKKKIKKGSDNLMAFGVRMPDMKTLEELVR